MFCLFLKIGSVMFGVNDYVVVLVLNRLFSVGFVVLNVFVSEIFGKNVVCVVLILVFVVSSVCLVCIMLG